MTAPELKELLDAAAARIRGNNPQGALEFLEQAEGVRNPRLAMLRGIALAQTGKVEQGIASLAEAKRDAATSPNVHYNIGVALYRQGNQAAARNAFETALELDPKYADPKDGLRVLTGEKSFSLSFDPGSIHRIQALAEGRRPWSAIGWGLVGLLIFWIVLAAIRPPIDAPTGSGLPLKQDATSILIVFGGVVLILSTWIWFLVDMIDRRSRVIWLIPMLIGCFLPGTLAIPLALYMAIGRR